MYKIPKSLENLINQFSSLPGVGSKSATRLVMALATGDKIRLKELSNSIDSVYSSTSLCVQCGNIIDASEKSDICTLCDEDRADSLMIIETVMDLYNIESSKAFNGYYHVLGGLVSPMRGIGFDDLNISNLLNRVEKGEFDKVICALPSNIEGDTTAILLKDYIQESFPRVKVLRLGRGLPSGANIEFLDTDTLKNSINNLSEY